MWGSQRDEVGAGQLKGSRVVKDAAIREDFDV